MINEVKEFTDSTNFLNALKVTLAAVIPAIIFSYLNQFEFGFAIAIGALLTYPSDIPSNFKHKIKGVFTAVVLVAGSNLLINILFPYPFLLYPIAALLIFFFAMIAVYGQRATMISFSALLAIALAFAHIHTGFMAMLQYSGLMFMGGLFYLIISLLFDLMLPHKYVTLQIAECIRLTSKYMKLRGDLWDLNADKSKIIEKQLYLQVELNTIHENLREILIRNRANYGNSNQNRKMLHVFISSVEILELALSTSFDHNKLHQKFEAYPEVLTIYQHLAYNLAASLKKVAKRIKSGSSRVTKQSLNKDLAALEKGILEYQKRTGEKEASDGVLMLTNMMHYAEKQIEKIKIIERAFHLNDEFKELKERDKDLEKLIAPHYYPISTLIENLSFSSSFFRHALRLTVTLIIGFTIGKLFVFQNSYWILLTIIVIMRPGYGLTKQRSYDRIIGTVVGGLIAFGLLHFIKDYTFIGTLAVLCMLLGFAFTQINYTVGATFVTIYVVFIYAILVPNSNQIVEFRIIDTLIGGGLAFIANYFFWPFWEFLSLPSYIIKSIEANKNYLSEIAAFYNKKGAVTPSYRSSRKNAFIEIGNLMASFQRMTQEPKSKQKQLQQVYKLVELNHSLLSALASLGTYIQMHHTTKASEVFHTVVNRVIKNLELAVAVLDKSDNKGMIFAEPEDLTARFSELKNMTARALKANKSIDQDNFHLKMQESQLVIEQLVWLINLSEGIVKASKKLELHL
ncbi:MAG TPA: FUSC family membrane protein [Flavobacterium sp.]|jgi:uncharacterized membrane protein (TIGR01666 family)